MSHQPRSSRFQGLFDVALQDYETTTEISLARHPLAEQVLNSHSINSITTFLQDQARELGEIQNSDRILDSIKNTVSVLFTLSATTTLGDAVLSVCSKMPMTVFYH
jgi:hypothetical protein